MKAQKITWTPEIIARHNIPTDAATFIKETRKGQNSNSDEQLRVFHAELMKTRSAATPKAVDEKIQTAVSIFKTRFPENCGKGFKFGFRVSETNSNVVEVANGGIMYCTINVKNGIVKGI